ncbi:5-(carboxyamino)imidazole ribonucleotide synthase [Haloplanus aerogenes]|uniref:N5-carboxyaminoimidazole ribonucleotide synthase n=1 Tax=Haloplanus aerogenes TaxID=660522 RepID=A0A3G8QVQ4_9EURY|nr:5-(carboxyamino)imidazole ribonucleotide synthase [Haloplanus aerogenes]AZH25532.1 5-(carboxyamino)imidazole ribonucleotide synthase [Haloplanus aerogenes]RMB25246.1 5-(carboxyamino)imidazole ribonucleotide synthase [Haloplanus aerogenes]
MTITVPGPTLGVVGGGQLGRMLAEAAAPLGVEVIVLDPTPDCPAAPVARDQIVGDFDDPDAISRLAERTDALTYEIELADPDYLADAGAAADVPVHPTPETLRTIQDKFAEKEMLSEAGIPVPEYRRVDSVADLEAAVEEFGAVMLKARHGGYDGRGNVPVRSVGEAEDAIREVGSVDDPDAVAETFVDFEREVSVIGVQGDGEVRTFPVGENVHEEEILRETVVPARTTEAVKERAQAVARDVLDALDGRGVFGIELFETREGEILVNEIAPRPHNSGHWSIEGAITSQFEQHARAVLGWPLGSTRQRAPTVSANILGTVDETKPATLAGVERVLEREGANLHWYGKDDVRPLRKMGHVTATGEEGRRPSTDALDDLLESTRELRDSLTFQ